MKAATAARPRPAHHVMRMAAALDAPVTSSAMQGDDEMDAPFSETALSSEAASAGPRKVIGEWTGGAAPLHARVYHARGTQPPQVCSESKIPA